MSIAGGTSFSEKSGKDVIISVGAGRITLSGAANLSTLNIIETPMNINNADSNATIYGTKTDDTIINSGERAAIFALSGKDSLNNNGASVTVDGGLGDDLISNTGKRSTLAGQSGSDTINNNAGKVLALGGAGNDSIKFDWSSNNVLIKHDKGDGSDLIEGFNSTSTLQIGDGNDSYNKEIAGDDVIVTVDKEKITLSGAAKLSKLNIDGITILKVNNTENVVALIGSRLGDSVKNSGNRVTIQTFAGGDIIENSSSRVTIDAGSGSDTIDVSNGSGNTILSGADNDLIHISPNETGLLIKHDKGDGSDLIEGFNSTSTLQIGDGNETLSQTLEGNDIIISSNNEVITLANASSLTSVNILGRVLEGMTIINHEGSKIISGISARDTIINSTLASNVTISGNTGDDSIFNSGANVLIKYASGDGSDLIEGFNSTSTLSISGDSYTSSKSGNDIIVSVGKDKITLSGAATLGTFNIVKYTKENPLIFENANNDTLIMGTSFDDTITNSGSNVTIQAQGGNDSIFNDGGYFSSIAGGEGSDLISVANSSQVTINAGKANDTINLSDSDETFIEYNALDGNDLINGFDDMATLNIIKTEFTSTTAGNDIIITVGTNKITLAGAASLSNPQIVSGTHATFTIENSKVTCNSDLPESVIKDAYQFNATISLLTLNDNLKNYAVNIKANDAGKVIWHYGTAILSSNSTLEYRLAIGENTATLTSKNYGDKITIDGDADFNFGQISAEVFDSGTVSTKSAEEILFEDNSSANITAPRNYKIDVDSSNIMVNDLPVNAKNRCS